MTDSAPRTLRITSGCAVTLDELVWEFTGSGGPGGQHANTANTKAVVVFDVAGSRSLSEHQRGLMLERLGAEVRIAVSTTRSQSRNRELALDRLRNRLAEGLRRDPPRRPTRPTRSAKRARMDSKRKRGDAKQLRRRPDPHD